MKFYSTITCELSVVNNQKSVMSNQFAAHSPPDNYRDTTHDLGASIVQESEYFEVRCLSKIFS